MKEKAQNTIAEDFSNHDGNCKYLLIEAAPNGKRIRIVLDNNAGTSGRNRTEGWFWNGSEWTPVYAVSNSEYAERNRLPKADCYQPNRCGFTKQTFRPYVDHVREVVLKVIG